MKVQELLFYERLTRYVAIVFGARRGNLSEVSTAF